jgi:hypothetical protein
MSGTRGFRFAHVPSPLRCCRCQKFGHTQQRCASHPVCGRYGEGGHGEEPRPNPPHCVNCSGAHASADGKCPVLIQEKDIFWNFGSGTVFPLWVPQRRFSHTNPRSGPSRFQQLSAACEVLTPQRKPRL